MKPIVFKTEAEPADNQADAWRDWFSPIFNISTTSDNAGQSFAAKNRVWDIGGILLSGTIAPAARVTRNKLNISRAPVDHWVITYNRQGETTVATERNTLVAPANVPYLWSLGDRFSSERSSVDRLQLLVPRDMLQKIAPQLDALRGSLLNFPLGKILGDYMIFLEARLDSIPKEELGRLRNAVRDMIASCLAPSADRIIAGDGIDQGRQERVKQFVQSQLGSPELTPAAIVKAVAISRTQLYRLFEQSGGVLRFIERQRLLRSYALLSAPANERSITSIAESLGFQNESAFIRLFEREFGHSPADVKFAAISSRSIEGNSQPLTQPNTQRFIDFLDVPPHPSQRILDELALQSDADVTSSNATLRYKKVARRPT